VAPTAATTSTSATAAATPETIVRVNLNSGVYHLPGSRYFANTGPHWATMTLAEAQAAGHRAAGDRSSVVVSSGVYSERRTRDGGVEIRGWIGPRERRAGLEREMMRAAEYSIAEIRRYELAHSTGAGLRIESGEGIRLAPRLVNQALQNRGIERFLREMRDLATGERLHLTTVTHTHASTLRLASIHYHVEVAEGDRMITLFDAVIEVRRNGQARAGVRLPGSDEYTFGPWVRD
jgi:hypothetical protein